MARLLSEWKPVTDIFTRVDSIVPVPGAGNQRQFYFFSGGYYTRIILGNNLQAKSDQGKMSNNNWATIADFPCIDAGMGVPGAPNDLYFFSGNNVIRCTLSNDANMNDTLEDAGDFPQQIWQQLNPFRTVDAIMKLQNDHYLFFSGPSYIRVRITAGGIVERVGGVQEIWPVLVNAGFNTVDACMIVPGTDNEAYIFHGARYIKVMIVELPQQVVVPLGVQVI